MEITMRKSSDWDRTIYSYKLIFLPLIEGDHNNLFQRKIPNQQILVILTQISYLTKFTLVG